MMEKIYGNNSYLRSRPLLTLSVGAALIAMLSFFGSDKYRYVFIWAYFYVPLLWIGWIISVFKIKANQGLLYYLCTWVLINSSILLMLIANTSESKNIEQSLGADSLMVFLYFPVIIPSILLSKILPLSIGHLIPNLEKNLIVGIVNLWLEMSIFAAFQSSLILMAIKAFKKSIRPNGSQ